MRKFGLLGKNISYSFSKKYFEEKFQALDIDASYENFDLPTILEIRELLDENPELEGFNVTIPYKEQIIPFLDSLDPIAMEIGAVNTVKISKSGRLQGYNTDYFGFCEAIFPLLKPEYEKALILGTGGASKAIAYGLESFQIEPTYVSRKEGSFFQHSYQQLDQHIMEDHLVIVNCTPLGTSPNTSEFPPIPIEFITENHLIFDLIYNPAVTKLMSLSAKKGASVSNGLKMLEQQAEKAWKIWNK